MIRRNDSPTRRARVLALFAGALAVAPALFAADAGAPLPARIEFNRDIRPILSGNCFACHGPDEKNRISGLRLDTHEGAVADLGGRAAVVPGSPEGSGLMARVQPESEALRMPPAYSSKPALDDRQVDLLRRWIEQGAEYQGHWSFLPPRRSAPPAPSNAAWARNPIDRFVLARLDAEGLKPSPEASPETLIRRLSLDLTGLPPTPADVEAFVADRSPGAYERLVDRLLESPRYGERMAARWLDAARYADTNGYQTDAERDMYRWRDWVIDAFNSNLPFDRFTLWQLAGDLLPNPTREQIVATGFNRNHRANSEGGIVAEEYRVEYVVDRVETASTVWMGLTLGCARCHDHKYDPFTQKEFYQLTAYFNSIDERGRVFKFGNTPPLVHAPTPDQADALASLDAQIAAAEKRFQAAEKSAASKSPAVAPEADWAPERGRAARFALDGGAPGVFGQATAFDGSRGLEAGTEPNFSYLDKFTISAWIYAEDPNGAIVSKTDSKDDQGYGFGGWGFYLIDGKLKVHLINRWLDDGLRVAAKRELPLGEWRHVAAVYDGSRFAEGVKIYVDGEEWETVAELDEMNQEIRKRAPVRIGSGGGIAKAFTGRIDEAALYAEALTPELIGVLAVREPYAALTGKPVAKLTPGQQAKLRLGRLEKFGPAPVRAAWSELVELRRRREALMETVPTVMVMDETPEPRPTFVLARGVYDAPAEPVERAVPVALPPLPAGAPNNRLGLAKWLVSDEHPLTARVTVNRFWQLLFGRGLVRTVEDFGSQGEWPTHPELLDWLAVEFRESGWNVKGLLKTIVMSAAYRQSSAAGEDLVKRDPDNSLLARGPRVRLPAEMVRDQALAVAGLLVEQVGGPSVKPYQPDGLWKELSGQEYDQDHGERLYRRGLYTFWKRTAPPPSMMNFDAAGREACTVQQTRTNTPLQALNLMNDVTYVEAARALAQRALREGGAGDAERLVWAFRAATARSPRDAERRVLRDSLDYYRTRYRGDPEAARALLSEGESPRDESIEPAEHAAFAAVASLILNLDEVVTKE